MITVQQTRFNLLLHSVLSINRSGKKSDGFLRPSLYHALCLCPAGADFCSESRNFIVNVVLENDDNRIRSFARAL